MVDYMASAVYAIRNTLSSVKHRKLVVILIMHRRSHLNTTQYEP
jgi:ABC-type protease/lipase transport system fused ATPase/permease subunit